MNHKPISNPARRRFLKQSALAAGVFAFRPWNGWGQSKAESLLSGVQISPHSLLDEGVEACLDFLQEHAAVNALFLYSQTYHMGTRPLHVLAADHPAPPRDPFKRNLPHLWMRLPRGAFDRSPIQHEPRDRSKEYGERDLFHELAEPCRKRGIKIYARILEAGMRRAERIPGYASAAAVDFEGNPSHGPCWNHPGYRDWIRLTIEEMMKRYPLDGLQYGAERVGPLSEVLFRGMKPACFCPYCRSRNQAAGIDSERAREGYRRLYEFVKGLENEEANPIDGVFTAVLRFLFQYPEILAWYREWFDADEEIQAMVYRTAKGVRPQADVGQHVDHQRSSWDVFYRAAVSYRRMAEHNDFVKPILYHDILGPRLKEWVIDRVQTRVLGDLSKDLSLELYYALFGHDASKEPAYDKLQEQGLSPQYVRRETERCVRGVGGEAKVYAGIGFDVPTYVPGGMERFPSAPETTYQATQLAIAAGAGGVVASREYDEMTLPNLQSFGRAVRSANRP